MIAFGWFWVGIIINHGNRLFQAPVPSNVRNFSDVIKRFDDVDAIMPKCLFLEPQAVCMKMVRLYKKNDPAIDKFFRKKGATLKKDNCVLPALLYAWILLKQGKNDDAFTVLTNAKKKSENPVLVANWEALANGKIKQFSNAGLGEAWYALGLEMPKMQRVQQQPQYRYR